MPIYPGQEGPAKAKAPAPPEDKGKGKGKNKGKDPASRTLHSIGTMKLRDDPNAP